MMLKKSSRILVFLVENQQISRICQWQICVDVLSLHFLASQCHFWISFVKRAYVFSPCFSVVFCRRCCRRGECLDVATTTLNRNKLDVKRRCDWTQRVSLTLPPAPHVASPSLRLRNVWRMETARRFLTFQESPSLTLSRSLYENKCEDRS